MKIHKYLLLTMTLGILMSCSNDDDTIVVNPPTVTPVTPAELSGEYKLTYLSVPQPVDFNMDGTASQNLVDESFCYLDTQIILNEDLTFSAIDSSVFFVSESGCQSEERTGTWSIDGENIILSAIMADNLTSEVEYTFDGSELYTTSVNATYPDRDAEGNPIYSTGDLQLTYTKVN